MMTTKVAPGKRVTEKKIGKTNKPMLPFMNMIAKKMEGKSTGKKSSKKC